MTNVYEARITITFMAQVIVPIVLLVAGCSLASMAGTWWYCERDGASHQYPSGTCVEQDARADEINPAAAQYDGLATAASVRAEYRRRAWKVPPEPHGRSPRCSSS
jgi:hypothetical protein